MLWGSSHEARGKRTLQLFMSHLYLNSNLSERGFQAIPAAALKHTDFGTLGALPDGGVITEKKNADSVNTTGVDKERVLLCVPHRPVDAETQHPTWKMK
jgi:hypothetical protein